MADEYESVEAEEQIDLEGDNDIEDMMDDEDPAEDDGYRRTRDEYKEQDHSDDDSYNRTRDEYKEQDPSDDDSYRRTRDEHIEQEHEQEQEQEQDHDFENEDHDEASEPDEAMGASGSMKHEGIPVESKDEVDNEKHTELLSLPPHGSEVFIGGLSRDTTEEDLREHFEQFGEIFEVKLLKDKEKRESKGFAFVTFTTKDAAQKAIEEIQDKEFKGKTLRCSLSQVKNRLFVGNLPKDLTKEELMKILHETGPGVANIEFFMDLQNPNRNRGFLFVEYYNHACAEYARQKMSSSQFKIDGSNPTITWAEPKNAAEASAASQVKTIYIKNLPEGVTSEKLKALFEHHGEVTKVVMPPSKTGQSKRNFGFVYFKERSSALKAVEGSEKYEIDGQAIEVVLAKPQTDKKPAHGKLPNYPQYPSYGFPGGGDPYGGGGDPYGAYGAAGLGQPVIYGRGPMPSGMRMVPMVLPDGRIGYVLQQPGAQAPPSRRSEHRGGSSESGGRGSDRNHGRRYRPY